MDIYGLTNSISKDFTENSLTQPRITRRLEEIVSYRSFENNEFSGNQKNQGNVSGR